VKALHHRVHIGRCFDAYFFLENGTVKDGKHEHAALGGITHDSNESMIPKPSSTSCGLAFLSFDHGSIHKL
jgi:hypothetical protein